MSFLVSDGQTSDLGHRSPVLRFMPNLKWITAIPFHNLSNDFSTHSLHTIENIGCFQAMTSNRFAPNANTQIRKTRHPFGPYILSSSHLLNDGSDPVGSFLNEIQV